MSQDPKKNNVGEHFRPLASIDVRGWSTVGMFAMVFYVLHLIATVPSLAQNELFKTVATILIGSGGFGLCCAFIWGGSKTTTGAIETVSDMARQTANMIPVDQKTTITTPPAQVVITPDQEQPNEPAATQPIS